MSAKTKVEIYSHFVKFTNIQPSHRGVLREFVQRYLRESHKEKKGQRWETVFGDVYAAKTVDNQELRIHRNCWDAFRSFLDNFYHVNIDHFDIEEKSVPQGVVCDFRIPEGFKLRDYQEKAIEKLSEEGRTKILELPPGAGKGLVGQERLRIPNGTKRMDDVVVGDIVVTPSGDLSTVTGVYQNEDKTCFTIYFEDGRHVTCDDEHLWKIYNQDTKTTSILNTQDIIELANKDGGFKTKDLKYLLSIPLIDNFHSQENDIKIKEDLYEEGKNFHLNKYGISGHLVDASRKQRYEFITGVMDQHGKVHLNDISPVSVSFEEEILATRLRELFWSIGCKAEKMKVELRDNDVSKWVYRVYVWTNRPSWLFRNSPLRYCVYDTDETMWLGIKDIVKVCKETTYCITVDHHEKMYVLEDFICTHNTSTSLNYVHQYKQRLGIVILGRYTDRWWQDLVLYVNKDEILEIRGAIDLARTIESIYDDPSYLDNIKVIMITTTTLQDYIKQYEKADKEQRDQLLPPEEIWEVLGIGIKLCDEAHQFFNANFNIDLYTHVSKSIWLSGTLMVADPFLKRMYEILYPLNERFGKGLQQKYIDCLSVKYKFAKPEKIKCRNRKKMYNHTRFENWIMSNPVLLKRYFTVVIDPLVKTDFLDIREPKHKCLLFFATKKMCALYVDHLKKLYPKLDVKRYISEDNYDNLVNAEVAVSTLGSAGTAVDVPDLLTAIMTTALKSEQANLQALGRPRPLRDSPHLTPKFIYLTCMNIDKHRDYDSRKRILFKDWVKTHNDYFVGEAV